jgi:hypothetical protein
VTPAIPCHECSLITMRDPTEGQRVGIARDHILKWCQLLVLAHKLSISDLAEMTSWRYQQCLKFWDLLPDGAEIGLIYDQMLETSEIRSDIIDLFVRRWNAAGDSQPMERKVKPPMTEAELEAWHETVGSNSEFKKDVESALHHHENLMDEDCEYRRTCAVHPYESDEDDSMDDSMDDITDSSMDSEERMRQMVEVLSEPGW